RIVHAVHALNLEEVVARAQRTHLRSAARAGGLRDRIRVGATQPPVLLAMLEITRVAEAFLDGPGRAPFEDAALLARRERPDRPAAEGPARGGGAANGGWGGRSGAAVTSVAASRVRSSRTPQLMSKPMPPGVMTPSSASIAATPPIGKP